MQNESERHTILWGHHRSSVLIVYVDGPASTRRPELIRIAWSLLVSQREEYRAYIFDCSVYQVDKKTIKTFSTRSSQSLIPEAIDHAQTTHPSAKHYIILTDHKYERDAGPQTQHPERWIWMSTKLIGDRTCGRSGNWIACDVSSVASIQSTLTNFRNILKV